MLGGPVITFKGYFQISYQYFLEMFWAHQDILGMFSKDILTILGEYFEMFQICILKNILRGPVRDFFKDVLRSPIRMFEGYFVKSHNVFWLYSEVRPGFLKDILDAPSGILVDI